MQAPNAKPISTNRSIARLAIPALGTLAIEPLYILTDTAIVGRIGTSELAGLALASSVLIVSFWLFNFLAYGTTARVAMYYGRNDTAGAARVAVQGLWASTGIGVLSVVSLLLGGGFLLRALGGSGDVLHHALTYLRISVVGLPAVLIILVGNGYMRGLQDTRTPLWIAAASSVVNLVVEIWFVFSLNYGVAGSAWSTVIAQYGAAVVFGLIMFVRIRATGISLKPDAKEFAALATIGRHLIVRTAALLAALTATTAVAARMGRPVLAAHQIAFQVFSFLALAVDALAIAAQALIGQALGAGDTNLARTLTTRLTAIGAGVGGILGAGLAAVAQLAPALFTPDVEVQKVAGVALLAVAALQIPGAIVFVLDGVLIGASDTKFLQYGTVTALAVFAPIAWYLSGHPNLGIGALYTGLFVWMGVRLIFNAARAWRPTWADLPSQESDSGYL